MRCRFWPIGAWSSSPRRKRCAPRRATIFGRSRRTCRRETRSCCSICFRRARSARAVRRVGRTHGAAHRYDGRRRRARAIRRRDAASGLRRKAEPRVVDELARSEADLAAVRNDLEKLALAGKRITLKDLEREALSIEDPKAYKYASALAEGRIAEALAIAHESFANDPRNAAVPLLSALATECNYLWELARPGGAAPVARALARALSAPDRAPRGRTPRAHRVRAGRSRHRSDRYGTRRQRSRRSPHARRPHQRRALETLPLTTAATPRLDAPLPGVPRFGHRVRREAVEVDANRVLLPLPPEKDERVVDREQAFDARVRDACARRDRSALGPAACAASIARLQ